MPYSPEQAKRVLHSVCPAFFQLKEKQPPIKKDEHQNKLLQGLVNIGKESG